MHDVARCITLVALLKTISRKTSEKLVYGKKKCNEYVYNLQDRKTHDLLDQEIKSNIQG